MIVRGCRRERFGFTLLEMMVSITIFVILALLMTQFSIQVSDVWQSTSYDTELRSLARSAMTSMVNELHSATRTSTAFPSPNLTISSAPNNDDITFYLPRDIDGNGLIVNATGNTEWDIANPVQYQYAAAERELRRLANSTSTVLCSDVTSVAFEDNSINSSLYDNELRILLTLQKTTPFHRNITVNLRSILKLRNR